MTIILINKKWYSFPQSWNELSTKQVLAVMKVIHGGYTKDEAYLQFIRLLSGCGWFNFFRTNKQRLYDDLHLCDFIFTVNNPEEKNLITNQLLPDYKSLYGPASNFENLRMNEYAYAQNYFEQYRDDDTNISALNKLVATLYRPSGGSVDDGDIRQPFKEAVMNKAAADVVSKWPMHVKELIYLWYGGCLTQLMEEQKNIPVSADAQPALHGIISLMRNVAKEGAYGDFEKVELMYVKMFFLELKENAHEVAQIK